MVNNFEIFHIWQMYQTNHSMHWFMYMNVIACVRKNIHCIYNLSAIATFWAFRKTWKRENVLRRRAWHPPPNLFINLDIYIIYYMHMLRFELNFIHFNDLNEIILKKRRIMLSTQYLNWWEISGSFYNSCWKTGKSICG